MGLKSHSQRDHKSHLSPENLCQGKCTTTTAEAKQTSKHDEEQGDVGNEHRDEAEWIVLGLFRNTDQLGRYVLSAKL